MATKFIVITQYDYDVARGDIDEFNTLDEAKAFIVEGKTSIVRPRLRAADFYLYEVVREIDTDTFETVGG